MTPARTSHKLSEQIAPPSAEIASQQGEDSVQATRPQPAEGKDRPTECASCQRIGEKYGPKAKKQIIAEKMREILVVLGLDLSDPSLAQTPNRIAKMYVDEIFAGLDPEKFPKLAFQEENVPNELILVKNISFVSFCEHHFVPIVGKAHVAYFPKKRVLGLSKIPRLVRYFAQRPQLQERLNVQIADTFCSLLETEDVAVALQAIHFCVMARGVEDMTAEMETHVLKGRFEKDAQLRSEFFSRISKQESVQVIST